MTDSDEIAMDGIQQVVHWNDERISMLASWFPPATPPDGMPFGASGVCVTPAGEVVLVSPNGRLWGLPGGRPEGTEIPEETLRREMLEEACVTVRQARLLGFCQIGDTGGPGGGVVMVRAWFRAEVELHDWDPQFEITHRDLVRPADVRARIALADGEAPLINRVLREAGIH